MASGSHMREITLVVRALDESSGEFVTTEHKVRLTDLSTVLDALISVKEGRDPSLAVRYSCRMGICGSCAMVINGRPQLACEASIYKEKSDTVEVEPMQGHPILRGLVTDFDEFFGKHASVEPWLMRKSMADKFSTKKEYVQTGEERDLFLPFAECIKCGLCVDACPVSNSNKAFKGPQALTQGYRYFLDTKDEGREKRLELLDTMDATWGCEFAGACSVVCPKSVDPALAIQLLKTEIMKYRLLGKKGEK